MDKDIERNLNYIHGRINANSKSNHIALLCVQQMLEILISDFSTEDKDTAYKSIILNSSNSLTLANKEIAEMNTEFKDLTEAARKRDRNKMN